MDKERIVERIAPELEPLMDRFFDNSREDIENMRTALAEKDLATLVRLGHTAKGTGYGYGFRGMGDIGLELELAAKAGDADACRVKIEAMAHYLDVVDVEFGE